ncbi:hypothetical protein VCR15J2_470855 [Vibrio coralliirubri]|nr:hypothetical protein VCR15J2_470855 [Vibrio coralliirubri]
MVRVQARQQNMRFLVGVYLAQKCFKQMVKHAQQKTIKPKHDGFDS